MIKRLVLPATLLLFLPAAAAAQGLLDEPARRAFWCEAANAQMLRAGKATLLEAAHAQMAAPGLERKRRAEAVRLGLTDAQAEGMQRASALVAQLEVAVFAEGRDPAVLSYDYAACLGEAL
jgi:hypothetical protein